MKRTFPTQQLALQRNATRPTPQRTFHTIDGLEQDAKAYMAKRPKTLNGFEPTKRVVVCEDVCTSDRIMA